MITEQTTHSETQDVRYDLANPEVNFGRRAFLGGVVGLGATLWALLIGGTPLLSYLWPKKTEEVALTELTFEKKISEFPPGSSKNFMYGSIPALLINVGGKLSLFNAKCTHLGCTVQFQEDKNRIFCACHGGTYNPETGKNIAGPPPAPLTPMIAEVKDDGTILIKRA